jgi:Cu(I)/Ag(I) efflux system membrane fusion protein/cobalt-zinc-cadmium efflux system membrane fusion protein
MSHFQLHPTRVSGSTRLGALIGVVVGVALASFLLLDPLDLHDVDDRLRGSSGDHDADLSSSEAEVQLWTCGMHPNVIQDEPGTCPICQMDLVPLRHEPTPSATKPAATAWTCPMHNLISEPEAGECPICGMDLVPVVGADAHAEHGGRSAAGDGPEVTIDRSMVQKMNVRFAEVERRDLMRRIATVGNLDYDEERMVSVTTRYSGFIEKVFANHVGQPVRRGDPLFEVYSPELVQTQRELISALSYAKRFHQPSTDVRARAEALVEAARTRLEYWEIPADRIAEIEATGEIHRTLTVFAPSDGVVMQRMHGLDGMAISPGMELLHIVDLGSLWLRAEVFEHQLPWLGIGSMAEVTFDYMPGEAFSGRVRYIEPEVSPETRTVTLTLEVPNTSGKLRVGMFATVNFAQVEVAGALTIPSQAVIRSGTRNIAVVDLGMGRFAPREVVLGAEADGFVEVIDGLANGDRIVVSAQFLIDSESNLRAAIGSLLANRGEHQH